VNGWQQVRPPPLPRPSEPTKHNVGHYAKKGWKTPSGSSIPRPQLLRSSSPTKDQNYYLSAIPEKGLARALFPLGGLTKAEVRKIAGAAGLPTAQRDESMGICFVGQKRKFSEFLSVYISTWPLPRSFPPSRSCHASGCSELPRTKARLDLRCGHRCDGWNPWRIVDVYDRSRSSVTGVKAETLHRFKEQGR